MICKGIHQENRWCSSKWFTKPGVSDWLSKLQRLFPDPWVHWSDTVQGYLIEHIAKKNLYWVSVCWKVQRLHIQIWRWRCHVLKLLPVMKDYEVFNCGLVDQCGVCAQYIGTLPEKESHHFAILPGPVDQVLMKGCYWPLQHSGFKLGFFISFAITNQVDRKTRIFAKVAKCLIPDSKISAHSKSHVHCWWKDCLV